MEVLILSKTHYGDQFCIGGMALESNQYLRLFNAGGKYQYADTQFAIGDVWEITFTPVPTIKEPHNEDVIIQSQRYIRTIDNLASFLINKGVTIWRGSINNIFDGKLIWADSGAGYLSENVPDYPKHSVGFWVSNRPLSFTDDHYFYSRLLTKRKLKYKGVPNALDTIPVNTLLRVSLAKWWKKDPTSEFRCYAQLSGWY